MRLVCPMPVHKTCRTLYVNPPVVYVPLEQKHPEREQNNPSPQLEGLPALVSGDELIAADIDGRARHNIAFSGVEQIDGKGHAALVAAGDVVEADAIRVLKNELGS